MGGDGGNYDISGGGGGGIGGNGSGFGGTGNVQLSPFSAFVAKWGLTNADQDKLIDWLGLQDVKGPIGKKSQIGLTVTVQGHY